MVGKRKITRFSGWVDTVVKTAFALSIALALTGCGGAGGGGNGGSSVISPGNGSNVPDLNAERNRTRSLSSINAQAAYDRGFTGDGITIGTYEFDIAPHPELSDQLVANEYDDGEEGTFDVPTVSEDQATRHAQKLAGASVAKRDGLGIHGVAYDAKLRFVSAYNTSFNENEENDSSQGLKSQAINYLNNHVPIAYVALHGGSWTSRNTKEYVQRILTRNGFLQSITQSNTTAADRTIWIYAAGNDATDQPDGEGYLGVHFTELQTHLLTIVAIDNDEDDNTIDSIASYSAKCGDAKDYCLAAPGKAYVPSGETGHTLMQGTSPASAVAAAALAIIKEAFPTIGNDELVTRIKTTANKSGIYAVEETYGQGLIDLAAATSQVGSGSVPGSDQIGGNSSPVHGSSIRPPEFFGDALIRGFAGTDLMTLDDLGAPFMRPLDSFVSAPLQENQAARFMHGLQESMTQQDDPPLSGGHSLWLGLQPTPLAFTGIQASGSEKAFGLTAATPFQITGKTRLKLTPGVILEQESTLGMKTSGAFGDTESRTAYLDVSTNRRKGGWNISAVATLGVTDPDNSSNLMQYRSPLISTGFDLRASRMMNDYSLEIGLSQPLRVESGSAAIRYPSARTPDRRILYSTMTTDLEPSGREITASAMIRIRHTDTLSAGYGIYSTRQPGHIRTAEPDHGIAAAVRFRF